ncbi:MAG: GDYXXLXY domain-containing protein, partial [Verrucomicrobiota bacterium]
MPLPQGFREWLAKESQLWHEHGILQPGQRDQILARYPEEEAGTGRMAFVLRAFGVLLFGAAVMLVVGHNWSELSRGGRLATVVAGVALLQGLGFWYTFNARRTGSVLGHLAGCLMFGAGIALVGQTYHMDAHSPDAVLAWCLGTLPFALALESTLLHLATVALASAWIMMELGGHSLAPSPQLIGLRFTFLLLLLPSAITAYRNRQPVIAGAIAWALMANWFSFGGGATAACFVLPLALAALHPVGSAYGRGFRFIGALGVTVITLIIGALGRWNSSDDIGLLRDPLLLALTLLAAGWALWAGKRDKDASRSWPAAIALGTLALGLARNLGFESDTAKAIVKAGANVLTLATAVWLVRTGLGEGRLRPYVYGSLVFLAWLTARYVDIAKDFGMLGTAGFFAAIGVILFILARVWRAQKDEAAPAAEPTLDLTWLERAFAAVTSRARAVVLVAALLQCLGLIWMAWNHSRPSEVGQRFVLRCQAIDPRDLMRGEYVTLGYEFSNPNPEDIKRLNREWIQLSGDNRRGDVESDWILPEDTMVYVPLKLDAKGLASGGTPTLKRPESGPYLKGYAGTRRFGSIRFGIEAFYVEEGTGNTWEKLRNQGLLVADIGVLPDGRAGLVGLRQADESMTKAIPFHRLEQHFYSGKNQWVQRYVIRTPEEFQRFLSPARVAGPAPRLPDFSKEIVVLISENET